MPPWYCAQIGAREHYAIPRALHRTGRLAALYTDFWAGPATRAVVGRSKMGGLAALAGRSHPDLADAPVVSWNARAMIREVGLRRKSRAAGPDATFAEFIRIGAEFSGAVREQLRRARPEPDGNSIFFAYDTGALEAMESARELGMHCVLNQMDPGRVEADLVRAEEQRWPGWTDRPIEIPEAYFARREQEWALADRIVVNSEFCRNALVQQGVPPEKLFVLPLSYEPERVEPGRNSLLRPPSSDGLRVLFLGQVILRKGIQYLVQAARLLERENIHFEIVGPIGISREAMAAAPPNLTFHGRASRESAAQWYGRADVFVLPTLSDGFALTQLEAMAHGLPVITTPCCGEVVTDEMDGYIVPPRDARALAAALLRYVGKPELLRQQRAAALEKARLFTLERLAINLEELELTTEVGSSKLEVKG